MELWLNTLHDGETSRILCMMLSTLKNRTVIGDHHPILFDRSVCNHHHHPINLGDIA